MKFKLEYLILIGLIAVLAVYLATRSSDRTRYELPAIAEVDAREFSRIEIDTDHSTVTVVKEDERWLLQPRGYPADPGKIENILATLSNLKTTALASEAKDYQRYELDEDRKISVKAWAGDTLKRELDIGKAAPSFRHTFVKLADDPRVYHARDNFRGKFDFEAADLQDKSVMRLEKAEVSSVHIVNTAGRSGFERQATGDGQESSENPPTSWQRDNGQTADRAAIEKLLGTVADLNCRKFIDGLSKEDLGEPVYTLGIKNGGVHTLSIYPKQTADADQYPATSSETPFPFYLSAALAEQIMQPPDALMPKSTDS